MFKVSPHFKAFALVIPAATLALIHHGFLAGAKFGNLHPYFALVASFVPDFYLVFILWMQTQRSVGRPIVGALLAAAAGEMLQIAASASADKDGDGDGFLDAPDAIQTTDEIIAVLAARKNRYGIAQSLSATLDLAGWLAAIGAHGYLAWDVYARRAATPTRVLAAMAVALGLTLAMDVFVRARVDGDAGTTANLFVDAVSMMLFAFGVLVRGPWRSGGRKKRK